MAHSGRPLWAVLYDRTARKPDNSEGGITMRLYRVEHGEDGKGPYQYVSGDTEQDEIRDALCGEIGMAHNDSWREEVRVKHPGPENDGLGYMWMDKADWLFACTSIETLHQWFAGYGERLRDSGFIVSAIDADDDYVKVGTTKRQAIYDPDYATVTGTREIGWV
jgi:hypothetical protein